jgi:hypothetical protein
MVINALFLPWGILVEGGVFIGVVRGGGAVTMSERPPNYLVYTEYTGALQSFYTFNYFTLDLLDGDTCLLALGLHPMVLLGPSVSVMPMLSCLDH